MFIEQWNWKNDLSKELGIPYSRFVASWVKIWSEDDYMRNLIPPFGKDFREWLSNPDFKLTEDEQRFIWHMATEGKLELEERAELFFKERRKG